MAPATTCVCGASPSASAAWGVSVPSTSVHGTISGSLSASMPQSFTRRGSYFTSSGSRLSVTQLVRIESKVATKRPVRRRFR